MPFSTDEIQRFVFKPRREERPLGHGRQGRRRLLWWLLLWIGAMALVWGGALAGAAPAPAAGPEARLRALEERVAELEATQDALLRTVVQIRKPASLEFAGEQVPLHRWDVRERLERELLLSVQSRGQVLLWLKRAARYFPYIEAALERAGLPDDLKYVAVIESALLPQALSHANAVGIWQFIPATGRRYGLRIAAGWDARRDPELATQAALAYLTDLYREFGAWPLALAAYNSGEGRVRGAIRQQGVQSYYQLALPAETERYAFRAFAAKTVLDEPERYGFHLPAEARYRPPDRDRVRVTVQRGVTVRAIADASGSFYREIRQLNPAITADRLPQGSYLLNLPPGAAAGFRLREAPAPAERPAGSGVRHRVARGETLSGIAQRHRVSVDEIRRRNPAIRGRHIRPGDVLEIR